MVTVNQVLKEISDEAVKIYNDHSYCSIWNAVYLAERIINEKYKGSEVVEDIKDIV